MDQTFLLCSFLCEIYCYFVHSIWKPSGCILSYCVYLWLSRLFGDGKRVFSEASPLLCASYFQPAEGKMFWAILDIIGFIPIRAWNKIVTSLPTNQLLFNKKLLIFTKLLFGLQNIYDIPVFM